MSEERTRPPGVWIVGILAILLGTAGGCWGAVRLSSMAFQDVAIEMQERTLESGQASEAVRRQIVVQRAQLDVARAWRAPTTVVLLANVAVSLGLLISAVLLFLWNPNATMVFTVVAAVSILVDIAGAGLSVAVGLETVAAIARVGEEIGGAQSLGLAQAGGTMGICVSIGWLLAKLGFYVGSIVYLRKETVRALFS